MVLSVMGPPTHSDPYAVLDQWSLEELITTYLHTRQWQRNERARELGDMLRQARLMRGGDEGNKAAREIADLIGDLLEPEYAVQAPREYSEAQRKVIFRGKR